MNLSQIKKEAREAVHDKIAVGLSTDYNDAALNSFLEETLDRLTDEIEKAVVPSSYGGAVDSFERGRRNVIAETREAFTRFKGESV